MSRIFFFYFVVIVLALGAYVRPSARAESLASSEFRADVDAKLTAVENELASSTGIRLKITLRRQEGSFHEYDLDFDEAGEQAFRLEHSFLTRTQVVEGLSRYASALKEYLGRTPDAPSEFLQRPAQVKRGFVEARLAAERLALFNAHSYAVAAGTPFTTVPDDFRAESRRLERSQSQLRALGVTFVESPSDGVVEVQFKNEGARNRPDLLLRYTKELESFLRKYSFELASDTLPDQLEALTDKLASLSAVAKASR